MNELKPEDVMSALEVMSASGIYASPNFQRNILAILREKDAEIERLKNSITFQVVMPDEKMEEIKAECLARVELDIKEIRAEAINEFSKRMEKSLTAQVNAASNEMLAAFMWCLDLVKNVEKQLKGETE